LSFNLLEVLTLISIFIGEHLSTLTLLIELLVALWQYINKARRRKKLSPYRTESRTQDPAFLCLYLSVTEVSAGVGFDGFYLVVYPVWALEPSDLVLVHSNDAYHVDHLDGWDD